MTKQELLDRYGTPGQNLEYVHLPYKMRIAWDTDVYITKFLCHRFVVDNLENIFNDTLDYYGIETLRKLGLDLFGGCFNIRNKRGGNTLSVHSWGLAVDIDPVNNQLKWGKDKARLARPEYNEFWNIVYKNGGISLGKEKNYDWMHFQFVGL